ncbi:MAG: hypothetical protein LUI39_06335 [Lachnospiraceae bacterium]|nr:hypothetical protein [Lachnospiraceae bacterium]
MQKRNDSQPFDKKSHFNDNRDSYVDESGNYVYTKWVKHANGKLERVVVDIVPLTAENRDIIILLDEYDHDNDLQERYDEENADYGIRNQRDNRHGNSEDEDSFDADPLESIVDPSGDVFDQLFPEEQPVDPKVAQAETFIHEKLKPEQQDMVYGHLGEMKYLEDIRREEETATGKKVTRQAVHGRWDRIITKACKEFGVEKPKQEHKKHSKE